MGRIKVKICGMRDRGNISDVAALHPDYMGFIDYAASPRYVGKDFLPVRIPPPIVSVGVFVNEATDKIAGRAKVNGWTHIQLHGNESPTQCKELRDLGLKVIKVFSVDEQFDFNVTGEYKAAADLFLFDTKGKLMGGNARVFNWEQLEAYDQQIPFFLSGGLNAGNIAGIEALKDMNLFGVDLNSGVEAAPGTKDLGKVRQAIELVDNL